MDYDIIIIGGGIAGISALARLAPHARVLLLEAEHTLAHHASGRSAALYEPFYGSPPVVALSLASRDFFMAGPDLLSPRGMMLVGEASERAAFEADMLSMQFDRLSVAEAKARVPILNDNVAFAAYADHAWDIDTDLLMQGFLRHAKAEGATVRTGAKVAAITRDRLWHVTADETYTAKTIVNASGPWADDVARMAGVAPLGLVPYRRSMARLAAPDGHDLRAWPIVFAVGEGWYAKPDAGALIVSPAEEHPMHAHDAFADDMVLAEGLARYQHMVTPEVTRPIATWAGLRTFAPDRALVIGRDHACPEFVWLAGQGGYGFQTSPAASLLVADLILGRQPQLDGDIVARLSPHRFVKQGD